MIEDSILSIKRMLDRLNIASEKKSGSTHVVTSAVWLSDVPTTQFKVGCCLYFSFQLRNWVKVHLKGSLRSN